MTIGLGQFQKRSLYKEYLQRLDASAVLDFYGVENASEVHRHDDTTEVIHSCLLDRVEPHHMNGDRNPSASCNLTKKLYVCYAYWGGDLIHLIQKMERKDDFERVIPHLGRFLGEATVTQDVFRAELERLFAGQSVYELELPSYSDRVLLPWATSHPYLREVRGVSLEACSELRLGYDQRENRIVFPHFWDGKLVGWQKRAIPGKPERWPATDPDWPKYKNTTGFPKHETIYGYDRARAEVTRTGSTVVVVESPMSVARSVSLGTSVPVLATFGASPSPRQIDLLKEFDNVVVWMDPDPAGLLAEKKLVRGLYRHTKVRVAQSDSGMDLADYQTLEEVETKIEEAQPASMRMSEYQEREYARRARD